MTTGLVLFSGGIDSTTVLFWARRKFDRIQALTFAYGQRHGIEIRMAEKSAARWKIPLQILQVDLTQIGGSALTDKAVPVPQTPPAEKPGDGPPATYVPFRNGIFLSLAAAWGEAHQIYDLACGFHVIDSPDYPDTREIFVKAMQNAINLGTKAAFGPPHFKLHAPFVKQKKSQIILAGLDLGADYSYSISCYQGEEVPCQKCSSCLLREQAWKEAGKEDHLLIRLKKEGKI